MLDEAAPLPEDPDDLRAFTARLLAEVKAQAVLIEKLRHQLAGHARHRFGASSETAEQLQLALETSEIAATPMTARLRLPEVEEKERPSPPSRTAGSASWTPCTVDDGIHRGRWFANSRAAWMNAVKAAGGFFRLG
jgi:Transposase C of IS166 homeodomain